MVTDCLPFAPRAVAAALAFRKSRTVWPGSVVAAGVGSPRLFVQMVGVGFDAQVVHALWLPMKRALGRADQTPAQADGDPAGRAPVMVSDAARPIKVIVG